jgi:hypothetical protein
VKDRKINSTNKSSVRNPRFGAKKESRKRKKESDTKKEKDT